MTRQNAILLAAAAVAAIVSCTTPVLAVYAQAATAERSRETVQPLMQKDLIADSNKELQMLTVEYKPGGASQPHQHHAQVMVYVLSGTVHMQVKGGPLLTLTRGQTFYEGPEDVHTVSENASRAEPAKILVFEVKDKT